MDKVRCEFAKEKVEKDNLQIKLDKMKEREKIWKTDIDNLKEEIQRQQNILSSKDTESLDNVKILEQKGEALISDLKFMRQEN